VHRDLTPSNILLSQQQVFLIDLDLAEKNSEQNVASFHPKGTVGFSSANKTQDLCAQDWEALEKIRIFLGLDKSVWRELEPQNKARKSWWAELF
jgi:serine/threonine protein kinase